MNYRKLNIISGVFFFAFLFQVNLFSQKISLTANRSRIFIGEQILLKLSVTQTRPGIAWFQVPDTLNHLEITFRSKIDTVSTGGYTNFYQTIAITSFDSGKWQFPALAIAGINQVTMPVTIDVVPVDVSKKKDYNDIKDIEEVKQRSNIILIATLLALTLFSLCMIIILVLKRKKTGNIKPVLENNETPWQWALKELNKLSVPGSSSPAGTKIYYAELNRISRSFFSLQLHQDNRQLTTDEWMIGLQHLKVENHFKTSFYQFLRLADGVRFAKYLPPVIENTAAMDTVKNMLHQSSLDQSNADSTPQSKFS